MPRPQPASSSARFLDESVLPIFTDLRMTAFGQSVIDIAADPAFDDWSFLRQSALRTRQRGSGQA